MVLQEAEIQSGDLSNVSLKRSYFIVLLHASPCGNHRWEASFTAPANVTAQQRRTPLFSIHRSRARVSALGVDFCFVLRLGNKNKTAISQVCGMFGESEPWFLQRRCDCHVYFSVCRQKLRKLTSTRITLTSEFFLTIKKKKCFVNKKSKYDLWVFQTSTQNFNIGWSTWISNKSLIYKILIPFDFLQ